MPVRGMICLIGAMNGSVSATSAWDIGLRMPRSNQDMIARPKMASQRIVSSILSMLKMAWSMVVLPVT